VSPASGPPNKQIKNQLKGKSRSGQIESRRNSQAVQTFEAALFLVDFSLPQSFFLGSFRQDTNSLDLRIQIQARPSRAEESGAPLGHQRAAIRNIPGPGEPGFKAVQQRDQVSREPKPIKPKRTQIGK
jgi:hypothetical protein